MEDTINLDLSLKSKKTISNEKQIIKEIKVKKNNKHPSGIKYCNICYSDGFKQPEIKYYYLIDGILDLV